MENKGIKSFSDLQGLSVSIPNQGRTVGVVDDLYFKPGTNAIDSLRVRTRLSGYKAIPVRSVLSVEPDTVTIASEQMMTSAVPPFPLVGELRASKVINAKGDELGVVGEVMLAVTPSQAMRITGIEVSDRNGRRGRTVNSSSIGRYQQNLVVIDR